jgi:hypothetical protein
LAEREGFESTEQPGSPRRFMPFRRRPDGHGV